MQPHLSKILSIRHVINIPRGERELSRLVHTRRAWPGVYTVFAHLGLDQPHFKCLIALGSCLLCNPRMHCWALKPIWGQDMDLVHGPVSPRLLLSVGLQETRNQRSSTSESPGLLRERKNTFLRPVLSESLAVRNLQFQYAPQVIWGSSLPSPFQHRK